MPACAAITNYYKVQEDSIREAAKPKALTEMATLFISQIRFYQSSFFEGVLD
jgi:hypothetical protein